MSTTGVCFFAYNNSQIDYVKLSMLAALHVKKHMRHNNTCLITTEGDWAWLEQSQGEEVVNQAFDDVVFTDNVNAPNNIRKHHDSPWTTFESEFKNSNKHLINEYTPYDKTLLLDIDYMVRNPFLDYLFESEVPVAMYDDACDLRYDPPDLYEQYLNPIGPKMWWSTVVYFDKHDEISKLFFDTWAHVAQEYDFYKFLYNFPPHMFRTDYCVSIASHIMNGMGDGRAIHKIMDERMQYMDQKDDLVEIKSSDDWIFLSNDRKEPWKDIVTRNRTENIHVMNKRAIERNYAQMLESVL